MVGGADTDLAIVGSGFGGSILAMIASSVGGWAAARRGARGTDQKSAMSASKVVRRCKEDLPVR